MFRVVCVPGRPLDAPDVLRSRTSPCLMSPYFVAGAGAGVVLLGAGAVAAGAGAGVVFTGAGVLLLGVGVTAA